MYNFLPDTHRESYMSAQVLLNLYNELGIEDKMLGLSSILSLFRNELKGSGSVAECLTRDRGAAGSSLIGVTVLWSLNKTQLS